MNIEEERKAFEAWYKKSYGINIDLPVMPNGQYPELRKQFSWDSWQASVNREGFVLIKNNSRTIVAIEQMVEQQVEASGITQDVFRLDGEQILEAMLSAQEQSNESN